MPALSNYALSQKIDLSGDRGETLNHVLLSLLFLSLHVCVCGCMCLLKDKRQGDSVTDSVIKRDYKCLIFTDYFKSYDSLHYRAIDKLSSCDLL